MTQRASGSLWTGRLSKIHEIATGQRRGDKLAHVGQEDIRPFTAPSRSLGAVRLRNNQPANRVVIFQ